MNPTRIRQLLLERYFIFQRFEGPILSNKVRFWPDGTISGSHNNNEASWKISNELDLVIYDAMGNSRHVFQLINENTFTWLGTDVDGVKHELISQPEDFVPHETSLLAEKLGNQTVGKHGYGDLHAINGDWWARPDLIEIGAFVQIEENVSVYVSQRNDRGLTTFPFRTINIDTDFKFFVPSVENEAADFTFLGTTKIGNDVIIGANTIILGGVTISDGVIIQPGSVITDSIPAYTIVGGNPAGVIRHRYKDKIVRQLEQIAWWEWSDEEINERLDDILNSDNIDSFIKKYLPNK
ncbi:MAG: hypothetical protein LBM27_00235 [Lactobacillaceae bacterium]|jgi:acetyltransferase-like isoleucine patch superfamily enzyme|nr:hypothetical protein [Lactobacillaceae bacterium]